jgi:hypothetical protein
MQPLNGGDVQISTNEPSGIFTGPGDRADAI